MVELDYSKSRFAIARLIGARALQIAMGAPILVELSEEELEKINYDPTEIALIEYKMGALPLIVKIRELRK